MKHITRARSGYMVRKRIQGHLYQSFFGDSACGGQMAARQAAIAYRDRFLELFETGNRPVYRFRNTRNKTGVIGVAWYPPSDLLTPDGMKHVIRARATFPSQEQRLITQSWSVHQYGLWKAYSEAVQWRHQTINDGEMMDEADVLSSFMLFMDSYTETYQSGTGHQRSMLSMPLLRLTEDSDAPRQVKEVAVQKARTLGLAKSSRVEDSRREDRSSGVSHQRL